MKIFDLVQIFLHPSLPSNRIFWASTHLKIFDPFQQQRDHPGHHLDHLHDRHLERRVASVELISSITATCNTWDDVDDDDDELDNDHDNNVEEDVG